jgi:hypothetical protein
MSGATDGKIRQSSFIDAARKAEVRHIVKFSGLILQRQLRERVVSSSVVGAAGLGLASSAPV